MYELLAVVLILLVVFVANFFNKNTKAPGVDFVIKAPDTDTLCKNGHSWVEANVPLANKQNIIIGFSNKQYCKDCGLIILSGKSFQFSKQAVDYLSLNAQFLEIQKEVDSQIDTRVVEEINKIKEQKLINLSTEEKEIFEKGWLSCQELLSDKNKVELRLNIFEEVYAQYEPILSNMRQELEKIRKEG